VSQLLACPFCRELFERSETEHCPECDIPLEPLHRLAPSYEAVEEDAARWERTRPEDERRPLFAVGRGRGALVVIALASLLMFWLAPWVSISSPHSEVRSGYSLARGPLGMLWGGAMAWFVSLALVVSRRTIMQMRGVRAILMVFAAMTASEIAVLLIMSPSRSSELTVIYEWSWGLYASLSLSLLGVLVAARFGGALPATALDAPARGASDAAPTVH
jgi:hypothetical protein